MHTVIAESHTRTCVSFAVHLSLCCGDSQFAANAGVRPFGIRQTPWIMSSLLESTVQGTLIKKSDGGDLYTCRGDPSLVYKQVHESEEMMHVCALQDRWVALQNTEWVVPLTVETRESGIPVGYLMRKAPGDTLHSLERLFCPESFPLPDVIGRLAICVLQALTGGIFPMIEHSGNVMVYEGGSASHLSVAVIDSEACMLLSGCQCEKDVLSQLEIIFGNFYNHRFFPTIFDNDGKLRYDSLTDIMHQCSQASERVQNFMGTAERFP